MKKHLFALISLAFVLFMANAQTPHWQWAKGTKGDGNRGYSVSVDANGNSYVTGFFLDTVITFDNITLTNQNVNGYSADIFLVKYDPSGKVVWARSAGGSGGDQGLSISTDPYGNIYVTGGFLSDTISFGSIILTNSNTFGSTSDFFIAKYDSSGNVIWAKSAGGSGRDVGYGISLDSYGNSYVTGHFDSQTIVFGSTILSLSGYGNFFISKYDSSGKEIWAKCATGSDFSISGFDISTDVNGNSCVTGAFNGVSVSLDTSTLSNADTTGLYSDIFLARYDSSGAVMWAKRAGARLDEEGESVSVDQSGNSYVSGYFQSKSITFGTTTFLNSDTSAANFSADIFIVKYDVLGSVVWAKMAGGIQQDNGEAISADIKGNIYATGWFWSDSIAFGTTTLFNQGSANIFIVKYDSSGTVLWAKSAGGNNDDEGFDIKADNNNNCFITGEFGSSSVVFDNDTLTNLRSGGFEFFIAKLNSITSVDEVINSVDFIAYPNPCSDFITVDLLKTNARKISITLIDLLGKPVYQAVLSENTLHHIPLKDIANGMYLLILSENNEMLSKKIIIEH